jgi:hypothetical protein
MTHIDAQRAIYIDFECLQRQPPQKPHPALLGVLIGAADEDFEQLITDDRLAPARIANRERTRIVLKATREREAWRAYERTRFCVDDGKRRICSWPAARAEGSIHSSNATPPTAGRSSRRGIPHLSC